MTLFALQAAAINLVVGSHVWVEDSDVAWMDGEVLEVKGQEIKVLCTSGKSVSIFFNNLKHNSILFNECF